MTQVTTPSVLLGPTNSARFGKTLYIDITTPHNSLVVERGSELPRASLIVTTCARELIDMSRAGDKLDHIIVTGTGIDPALHPDLRNIAENVRALRDKWFSRAKFCLMTQNTDLDSYNVRSTLGMFNKVFVPLHWGNTKQFTAMTGAKSTELGQFIKHISGMENVVVEAQFAEGTSGNMAAASVTGWIKKVGEAAPSEVHLLSGTPPTVKKTKLKASTKTQRNKIADQLVEKTGLPVAHFEQEDLPTK